MVKALIYIKMLFIFSTPALIRHLWQHKTSIFLHWSLIRAVPLRSANLFKDWSICQVKGSAPGVNVAIYGRNFGHNELSSFATTVSHDCKIQTKTLQLSLSEVSETKKVIER